MNFLMFSSPAYMKRCNVLWKSIMKHHPDAHIHLNKIEDVQKGSYPPNRASTVFGKILNMFDDGWPDCCLIDVDCELFGRLNEIEELLKIKDVVLLPHVPFPPIKRSHGMELYQTGHVNGGLITFKNTSNAREMIKWIIEMSGEDERQAGAFYEQTWASSLPFLFDGVGILRDKRYNVAYWSLKAGINVEFSQVKHIHYSGFNEADMGTISKHYHGHIPEEWRAVFERYRYLIT